MSGGCRRRGEGEGVGVGLGVKSVVEEDVGRQYGQDGCRCGGWAVMDDGSEYRTNTLRLVHCSNGCPNPSRIETVRPPQIR
jgi:hypothetical protein